jgi:hypothetical protein
MTLGANCISGGNKFPRMTIVAIRALNSPIKHFSLKKRPMDEYLVLDLAVRKIQTLA